MLTKNEKLFLEYWEKNRENEKQLLKQLAGGLPMGLVFALPVLVAVLFHDWYKNMIYISDSQMIVIIIAVLCIAIFFSLFRGKFKWEHNEQLYKELKFKQSKDNAAD
jgi:ABC-type maltose transport system permease subunit